MPEKGAGRGLKSVLKLPESCLEGVRNAKICFGWGQNSYFVGWDTLNLSLYLVCLDVLFSFLFCLSSSLGVS